MPSVESLHMHGRGWTVAELRLKDWEDLHRLWWVCIKERNRLNTFISELQRSQAGYGQNEAEERLKEVSNWLLFATMGLLSYMQGYSELLTLV